MQADNCTQKRAIETVSVTAHPTPIASKKYFETIESGNTIKKKAIKSFVSVFILLGFLSGFQFSTPNYIFHRYLV